jgi:hypothetical protein
MMELPSASDWLPAGVGLDDAIAGLAALAVLVTSIAMWQALRPNTAFERRLQQIAERKETIAARRWARATADKRLARSG